MHDWANVWPAVADRGFQIKQFADHFTVSMVVMELPDDFEMEHNGQIHLEPRRMRLPRELFVFPRASHFGRREWRQTLNA